MRDAVLAIDPQVPPPRLTTLGELTGIVVLPQRAGAIVTGTLGAAGLLLAAIGLYGLLAFNAGRRTREVGIRVALGATRSSVLQMFLADGLVLAATGIIVGLGLAALATRTLAPYLFSVSPFDPLTFVVMSAAFLVVAAVASFIPARRAAAARSARGPSRGLAHVNYALLFPPCLGSLLPTSPCSSRSAPLPGPRPSWRHCRRTRPHHRARRHVTMRRRPKRRRMAGLS